MSGTNATGTTMNVKLLDLQAQYLPIRNEIRRAIDDVCDSQALILGPHVEKFEKHLAEYCGTRHAIGVSSGTDALLCALMGIGVGPGDEVICPSFTFFATAGSIARLGATPVFAEIDSRSFNLDPERLAEKITPRTKAVIPVHLFGQMARMDAINKIAGGARAEGDRGRRPGDRRQTPRRRGRVGRVRGVPELLPDEKPRRLRRRRGDRAPTTTPSPKPAASCASTAPATPTTTT